MTLSMGIEETVKSRALELGADFGFSRCLEYQKRMNVLT